MYHFPDPKDPADILDYQFDWSIWLANEGDTIATYTLSIPTGITMVPGSDSEVDGVITFWLSGGTDGQSYAITNQIKTAGGRTKERTAAVRVKNNL